jgi:hypothetical protein
MGSNAHPRGGPAHRGEHRQAAGTAQAYRSRLWRPVLSVGKDHALVHRAFRRGSLRASPKCFPSRLGELGLIRKNYRRAASSTWTLRSGPLLSKLAMEAEAASSSVL